MTVSSDDEKCSELTSTNKSSDDNFISTILLTPEKKIIQMRNTVSINGNVNGK